MIFAMTTELKRKRVLSFKYRNCLIFPSDKFSFHSCILPFKMFRINERTAPLLGGGSVYHVKPFPILPERGVRTSVLYFFKSSSEMIPPPS